MDFFKIYYNVFTVSSAVYRNIEALPGFGVCLGAFVFVTQTWQPPIGVQVYDVTNQTFDWSKTLPEHHGKSFAASIEANLLNTSMKLTITTDPGIELKLFKVCGAISPV